MRAADDMQEKAKSTRLQESVKQLNAEKARTESLLYQMIPKSVADRLREGESHANTCQASSTQTRTVNAY